MTKDLKDLTFFDDPDIDRLAQLVFDLAAQLHAERQRRMALETLLAREDLIDGDRLAALADDEAFLAEARSALGAAQARLLAILAEHGDRRSPLRHESPSVPTDPR